MKVTILGCGSSQGNPRVGLGWGACDPNEPKNRRLRCAALVETETTRVLIDAGPDLREQLIRADVQELTATLITHEHADHCHGIDDLRPLALKHRKRQDVYTDKETASVLLARFGYCFEAPAGSNYPPILKLKVQPDYEEFHVGDIAFTPLPVGHGQIRALAFTFNGIGYMPDVKTVPEQTQEALRGLDVLIIDALRYEWHVSHFNLDEALAWIERLAPKRAILTNLHCDLDYKILSESLPSHIKAAYDMMSFTK